MKFAKKPYSPYVPTMCTRSGATELALKSKTLAYRSKLTVCNTAYMNLVSAIESPINVTWA